MKLRAAATAFLTLCAASDSWAHTTTIGKPHDPRNAARTVAIDMSDTMRYSPAEISVKRGEAIRFVVTNSGQLAHEIVLGTMQDLKDHAAHMQAHPAMDHHDPNMLQVAPGKSGEMGWQFTRAGEFFYGCLVPGHLEAGMIGKITVREP